MDINFHYYAIKAAAVKAGFEEKDAQTIASYSQFVDDYSNYEDMVFEDVPDFVKAYETLVTKQNEGWIFEPVTTGFNTFQETARLNNPENQRNILVPFHFIPNNKKLNQNVESRIEWRVVQASLDKPSLIQQLLLEAQKKYKEDKSTISLIRIGVLLHIFADTYAHQKFSGFHDWENHSELSKTVNNIDGSVIPGIRPEIFGDSSRITANKALNILPSIGHANIGHTPDESNISFCLTQKVTKDDKKYSESYSRNNTKAYLIAIQEIINYLRNCLDKGPIKPKEWEEMSKDFTQGFYTTAKNKNELSIHWNAVFPDITFNYNKEDQYKTNKYKKAPDEFFHYNIIAKKIRDYVNGENIAKPFTVEVDSRNEGGTLNGGILVPSKNKESIKLLGDKKVEKVIPGIKDIWVTVNPNAWTYSFTIHVLGRNSIGWKGISLFFTDDTNDTYKLWIESPTEKEHTVNYNSLKGNIKKITWEY